MSGDAESAYQFLVSRPEVIKEQIAVAGTSCGGREAISLAARHDAIRSLVFLSSSIGGRFEEQYQSLTDLPVFCITSENDPFGRTAESMKQAFTKSRNPDSRLLIYKGDKHGTPLFAQDANLEATILGWFEKHLKSTS
jgi:dienelactone hydrolase